MDMTVQKAASNGGVLPRQVQILCKGNRIVGATRIGCIWVIPENTEKPTKDSSTRERKKDDKR